jgi:hypothetical protein
MPLSRKHFRRSRDAPMVRLPAFAAGGIEGIAALVKEPTSIVSGEAGEVNTD